MSKQVQEMFSSIAPSYDFLNHFLSFSIDKKWRKKALDALDKGPYTRILDLCAGTLDLTKELAIRFPDTQIISADFSLAMLKHGLHKIPPHAKTYHTCGDGHHLPFKNHSFDAVICAFGIRNLEKRVKAVLEIHRVLKKGGQLVILDFFRPKKKFSKLFYKTYGKHILPRIGSAISKNPEAYRYLQSSILDFLSVEDYSELLNQHGFQTTHILSLSGGIAHRVSAKT